MGHDLHLEEAEVPTDSELKEEAYDSDDSDIYDVLKTYTLRKLFMAIVFEIRIVIATS